LFSRSGKEAEMRSTAISAILLGVVHVAIGGGGAAAMPQGAAPAVADALGGAGGATLARAGATPFLDVPATTQSALLPVGEGGEGGRGRWRGRGYQGYGWGPPPGYYYRPPRVVRRPPPVYYAPPPAYYYAPPPPRYYVPTPGVSLHFRF
jgi:hypothetical protein